MKAIRRQIIGANSLISPPRWLTKLDQKIRFIIVGGAGTSIAWLVYNLLYLTLPFEPKAIIAWIICYIYSVAQNHTLHRNLTFFTTDNKYFPELFRAYLAYSLGLFVSTANHAFLTQEYEISHQLSWIVSTLLSIICNYIMLRFFVFKANKTPSINSN